MTTMWCLMFNVLRGRAEILETRRGCSDRFEEGGVTELTGLYVTVCLGLPLNRAL